MRLVKPALMASALVLTMCAFSSPVLAAGPTISKVRVVGNNVVIKSSGGTTTVDASNSCSPGISGYLFQSVMVLFGGGAYNFTQTNTCP